VILIVISTPLCNSIFNARHEESSEEQVGAYPQSKPEVNPEVRFLVPVSDAVPIPMEDFEPKGHNLGHNRARLLSSP
jgi:hypothetical protein